VVGRGALDPVLRDGGAAHEIAATDDDGDLHAELVDLLDLVGEIARVLGRDAERTVAEKGLTRELQQDALIFRRARCHRSESTASPSANRWNLRIDTFSPTEAASVVTRSFTFLDASRM